MGDAVALVIVVFVGYVAGVSVDVEGKTADVEGKTVDVEGKTADVEGKAVDVEGKAAVLEELEGVDDVNALEDDGDCTVFATVVETSVDNFDAIPTHVCGSTAALEVISKVGVSPELSPAKSSSCMWQMPWL